MDGDDGVTVERRFAAPRELVWALLADTNRYDRALGLSRAHYTYRTVDGKRRMVGEARQSGVSLSWYEDPYQWVEGRYLEGQRRFMKGPASSGGLRIVVEDDGDGCVATVTAFGKLNSIVLRLAFAV